jgi:glycosyltransferase involved in cell wall biosynthesis
VGRYDAFHIVDHSYAHLVHELPSERTGVLCHDLDTFRCLLGEEVRPRWFRAMTRRILAGLEKAAVVFCTTETMEAKLANLIEPRRIVRVALGTAPEFHRGDATKVAVKRAEFLLHVGSCIPRKRIDVLLETFAGLRKERPALTLVQVGGAFTPEQASQAARLGVAGAIDQRRGIARSELADLYRTAAIVLQPSEREGFAIPVIEALACGARVLASDIPVLREVGGDAVVFSPVGDVASWVDTARCILNESREVPTLETRLRRAAPFSWSAHAATVAAAYTRLVG